MSNVADLMLYFVNNVPKLNQNISLCDLDIDRDPIIPTNIKFQKKTWFSDNNFSYRGNNIVKKTDFFPILISSKY